MRKPRKMEIIKYVAAIHQFSTATPTHGFTKVKLSADIIIEFHMCVLWHTRKLTRVKWSTGKNSQV